MNSGASTRRVRHSRPGLERLEGRALLSGGAGAGFTAQQTSAVPGQVRRLDYTTPQGGRVDIQLYGVGNFAGSTLDRDGALNLVFSGTNAQSGIIANVHGGNGRPALRSLRSAGLSAQGLSGVGGALIDVVNLKGFDLVDGGRINLTGGVHTLFLDAVGADTQVNLRELPEPTQAQGQGGSAAGTQNGETLGYGTGPTGGAALASVGGQFVPGTNIVLPNISTANPNTVQPGPGPAPPGVVVKIDHVNGPARDPGLGDPQIFGYDPTANTLTRFDATTGNPTLTTFDALPGGPGAEAGVALGRDNGRLVALVSDGANVYAFNTRDGSRVGQFSTAGLGLTDPTRLGTFDGFTVLGDRPGQAGSLGTVQPIDLTASLAAGKAVANAPAFSSQRAFALAGGLSGVPGLDTLFATGGAHFDPYQPNVFQVGIAALNPAGAALRESSRAPLTSNGATTPSDAFGTATTQPTTRADALGSLGQSLALVTGLATDAAGHTTNTVSLYSPQSFAKMGTVALNDRNRLSGLSETFYPALAGAALVDVQGNTQSFRAKTAQGLVFNGEGNVNLVKIDSAVDTTVLGYPFGHAAIPRRSNVIIVSSRRVIHDRNGVSEQPGLKPTGPLSLP